MRPNIVGSPDIRHEIRPDVSVASVEHCCVRRKSITPSTPITTSVSSRWVSCRRVYGVKSGTTWKSRSSEWRVRAVYTSCRHSGKPTSSCAAPPTTMRWRPEDAGVAQKGTMVVYSAAWSRDEAATARSA